MTCDELSMHNHLEWHNGVVVLRTVDGARAIDTCDMDTSGGRLTSKIWRVRCDVWRVTCDACDV